MQQEGSSNDSFKSPPLAAQRATRVHSHSMQQQEGSTPNSSFGGLSGLGSHVPAGAHAQTPLPQQQSRHGRSPVPIFAAGGKIGVSGHSAGHVGASAAPAVGSTANSTGPGAAGQTSAAAPSTATVRPPAGTIPPVPGVVQPHWSIFYPGGIEAQPPPLLHFLYIGSWCTRTSDYYLHTYPSQSADEENRHRVLWLHTALPRDRFVFLVEPVEVARPKSIWTSFWTFLYGTPPAFAFKTKTRGTSASSSPTSETEEGGDENVNSGSSIDERNNVEEKEKYGSRTTGVETVEVLHTDITAIDYAAGLTSQRLALETQVVTTLWFPSRQAALEYYKLQDSVQFPTAGLPRDKHTAAAAAAAAAASALSSTGGTTTGVGGPSTAPPGGGSSVSLSPLPQGGGHSLFSVPGGQRQRQAGGGGHGTGSGGGSGAPLTPLLGSRLHSAFLSTTAEAPKVPRGTTAAPPAPRTPTPPLAAPRESPGRAVGSSVKSRERPLAGRGQPATAADGSDERNTTLPTAAAVSPLSGQPDGDPDAEAHQFVSLSGSGREEEEEDGGQSSVAAVVGGQEGQVRQGSVLAEMVLTPTSASANDADLPPPEDLEHTLPPQHTAASRHCRPPQLSLISSSTSPMKALPPAATASSNQSPDPCEGKEGRNGNEAVKEEEDTMLLRRSRSAREMTPLTVPTSLNFKKRRKKKGGKKQQQHQQQSSQSLQSETGAADKATTEGKSRTRSGPSTAVRQEGENEEEEVLIETKVLFQNTGAKKEQQQQQLMSQPDGDEKRPPQHQRYHFVDPHNSSSSSSGPIASTGAAGGTLPHQHHPQQHGCASVGSSGATQGRHSPFGPAPASLSAIGVHVPLLVGSDGDVVGCKRSETPPVVPLPPAAAAASSLVTDASGSAGTAAGGSACRGESPTPTFVIHPLSAEDPVGTQEGTSSLDLHRVEHSNSSSSPQQQQQQAGVVGSSSENSSFASAATPSANLSPILGPSSGEAIGGAPPMANSDSILRHHELHHPIEVHKRRMCNTILTVYSQDPHFNAVLREVLLPEKGQVAFAQDTKSQQRLLALYETGMPTWTLFVARKGLMPYRRWMRLVAVFIINLWPLIALGVGLYDLYKHMPFLKDWLAERFTPFTEWLNAHFTLQLSFFLTYIATVTFGVMQALHGMTKAFSSLFTVLLQPFASLWALATMVRYPLMALWTFLVFTVKPLVMLLWTLGKFLSTTLLSPFRAIASVFTMMMQLTPGGSAAMQATAQGTGVFIQMWLNWLYFWDKILRPVKNVLKACYDGIVHLGVAIARREMSLRRWYLGLLSALADAIDYSFTLWWNVLTENFRLWRQIVPMWVTLALLTFAVYLVQYLAADYVVSYVYGAGGEAEGGGGGGRGWDGTTSVGDTNNDSSSMPLPSPSTVDAPSIWELLLRSVGVRGGVEGEEESVPAPDTAAAGTGRKLILPPTGSERGEQEVTEGTAGSGEAPAGVEGHLYHLWRRINDAWQGHQQRRTTSRAAHD